MRCIERNADHLCPFSTHSVRESVEYLNAKGIDVIVSERPKNLSKEDAEQYADEDRQFCIEKNDGRWCPPDTPSVAKSVEYLRAKGKFHSS